MLEFEEPITYKHDHLQLSARAVVAGDTIEFTVTNTTMTEISLGCGNPWTLQQQKNGRWREMMWTTSDVFNRMFERSQTRRLHYRKRHPKALGTRNRK